MRGSSAHGARGQELAGIAEGQWHRVGSRRGGMPDFADRLRLGAERLRQLGLGDSKCRPGPLPVTMAEGGARKHSRAQLLEFPEGKN